MSRQIVLSTQAIRSVANYYKLKIPRANITKEYLVKRLVKGNVLNSNDPYTDLLEKYRIIHNLNDTNEMKVQMDLWLSSMPLKC
jgi:hypothetical protein